MIPDLLVPVLCCPLVLYPFGKEAVKHPASFPFLNCCFDSLCVRRLVYVEIFNTCAFYMPVVLFLENTFFHGYQFSGMLLVAVFMDKNAQISSIMLNILENKHIKAFFILL